LNLFYTITLVVDTLAHVLPKIYCPTALHAQ